jgi:predicted aminopeptidase
VLDVRDFAQAIGLDVDQQYTSYLPWPGDRIITNLVVTEPASVEARPFQFPLIGAMPYKGFFDESMAQAEAAGLRRAGMDVCLVPVRAYSTLGFFEDPVSDPMLASGEGRLTETVLHELVHSTFFLKSRPDFNEGAANFVGQEASVLFLASTPEKAARRRQEVEDARALALFLLDFRAEVGRIYQESDSLDLAEVRREAAEAETRERLKSLPLATYDRERLADEIALNDACLALRGTYSGDLPEFERALARFGGDLPSLIAGLKAASSASDPRAEFFGHAPVAGAE